MPLRADTVTLKSGEVLNGTVVSETDQEILMDVTVGSGITDQKKIARTDVATVTKTAEDEMAYAPLKNLAIGPRSLTPAGYDAMIKPLEGFLARYPQSAHAADVKARLEAFKGEQAKVKAGSLKWNNRWYTPAEIEKNKAVLGSEMLWATMKDQAARRDFIGALNSFDTFEKTYPTSRLFPDAADLAMAQMRVAASEMERIRANAKYQDEQFNRGLLAVDEAERIRMANARKAQVAASEAQLAAAEKAQVKWKPVLPLAPKSLEMLKTTLTSEAPRVGKIPVEAMRKSLAATDDAAVAAKARKITEANAKLREAQTLWKDNAQIAAVTELLKRGPQEPAAATAATSGSADAASSPDTGASAEPGASPAPSASPEPKWKKWFRYF